VENRRALILTQLWAAGETCEAIGKRFGVAASTVHSWARKYKLPRRERPMKHREVDPTLEEIERLKAELKRLHIESRIAEAVENSQAKARNWRNGVCKPKGAGA
jgi:transposase-like protein